ncbi:MAG: molybdenum cofactor guanylyltransferase [Planctomycetaceae bacterium]|nr:molybdenum cofactor guanylyltransferase [Planctomycetaceae bacterium]
MFAKSLRNLTISSGRTDSPAACGGVILCGGRSRRMGQSKAWLQFGDETCLQRAVRMLTECIGPIVVVAAPQQTLPQLPDDVRIVRDPREGDGPLAGLALGLETLADVVDRAYVTGCDIPLLQSAFVSAMIAALGDTDVAVPVDNEFLHPLAAVYRTHLAPLAWQLIANDERRPRALIEQVTATCISTEDLRRVDPHLLSLENMNTPDDYQRLLALSQGTAAGS